MAMAREHTDDYSLIGKTVDNEHILKSKDLFTLSDYEKVMLSRAYDKLYKKSQLENARMAKLKEDDKLYNLSLKQIATNLSVVLVQIINDLVVYFSKENKTLKDFLLIFAQKDRLIYVGILLVILALIFFFIETSA